MLLQDTTPVGSKDYTDSCITFNTTLGIFGSTCIKCEKNLQYFDINPLSPNSDQHQFSPNNIHRLLRAKSMKINKMITKRNVFDLKSKFSQLIF